MTSEKTEYHLRVVHERELLHAQSGSPFSLPREGEVVILGSSQYTAIRLVHTLSLQPGGALRHETTVEVEPRDDLLQHAST